MIRAVLETEHTGCWQHWERCLGKTFVTIRREVGKEITGRTHT